MMMGPGMMGGRGGRTAMCNPRAAGLAEWRVERIERLIKPTDAQRTALEALRTASAKAAETVAAACPQEFPAGASARMELMEKRMETMLASDQDGAAGLRCVLCHAHGRAEEEAR